MRSWKREVVIVIRPLCIFVNVDQGFMSGYQSWWFYFAGIGLARVPVRAFGVKIDQSFWMPTFASEPFLEACR